MAAPKRTKRTKRKNVPKGGAKKKKKQPVKKNPIKKKPVAKNKPIKTSYTLYYRETCPYSQKVLAFMTVSKPKLKIMKRNLNKNSSFSKQLLNLGGMVQVPCLVIRAPSGKVRCMYESDRIVDFLATKI